MTKSKATTRVFLFLLSMVFAALPKGNAQFGIRVKADFDRHHQINESLSNSFGGNQNIFSPSVEAGIDYWFTLGKKRIEFLPEVAYAYGNTTVTDQIDATLNRFVINFHTQIYALDLNEDCNCPTFAKQGPSINKGFFLHFTPGVSYSIMEFTVTDPNDPIPAVTNTDSDVLTFHAGLGLGMDIGLSELVTITPMASYYFHSKGDYIIPAINNSAAEVSGPFTQLQFQVRTGFRFDYKRSKYGRRR